VGTGEPTPRSEVGSEPEPHHDAGADPAAETSPELLIPRDLSQLARTSTISDMWATIAEAGIPPPPVPVELVPQVRPVAELHWGTLEVDPLDLYVLRPFVQWAICDWDRRPAFLFGRYNSPSRGSLLTLFVARGPFAVLVQHPWAADDLDPVETAADAAACYTATRLLLDGMATLEPPARRLLHIHVAQDVFTMLDLPEAPEHFLPEPAEPIYHAPRRYDSLPELFAAAFEALEG
jgi:hypothetical protein